MLKTIAHRPARAARPRTIILLPLALSVIFTGGCFSKKRPAIHSSAAAVARPIVHSPGETTLDAPPDIREDAVAAPVHLSTPRSGPARPRVPSPPAPEPAGTGKAADPLIVPELSSEELATSKMESARSLEAAERKLGQIQGRTLNATQIDLASKVRGFMESAREAMKNGDWLRAKNLSRKAEVLSAELDGNP